MNPDRPETTDERTGPMTRITRTAHGHLMFKDPESFEHVHRTGDYTPHAPLDVAPAVITRVNETMLSGVALPMSHYEAATLLGALAYTLGNDVAPDDTGVLNSLSVRLRAVINASGVAS